MQTSVKLLIGKDRVGYAALTASLAELTRSVMIAFPSNPRQSVADIVTLYEHAIAIETAFNQVP